MFLEQEIIWTLLVAILTGGFTLAGVYITHYFQNKSSVIMEKTKAEAIQKLKIDGMVSVINGTEELKSTIDELNSLMLDTASDMLGQISKQNYSHVSKVVWGATKKFKEDSRVFHYKINKFVFLIVKDGIFNRKNDREHNEILEGIEKIQETHFAMVKDIIKIESYKINDENIESIGEEFKNRAKEMSEMSNDFIISILDKYEVKLRNI